MKKFLQQRGKEDEEWEGRRKGVIRVNKRATWRRGEEFGVLIPPHALPKFKILIHYENEPQFNCVYSRNCLHNSKIIGLQKIKDDTHVINLDEYKLVRIF